VLAVLADDLLAGAVAVGPHIATFLRET